MSLRVAFFTGAYDYILDGVALTSNRQVRYLLDQNLPVRVYAPTGKRLLDPAGDLVSVPSIRFPGNPYRLALGLTPATRHDLQQFRPSLVHLATPDLLGIEALLWAKRKRIPVVSTFHTHFGSYLKYYRLGHLELLADRYLSWFYSRCDRVFVATPSMVEELRAHGVHANYILNPFGVEMEQFSPGKRSQAWRDSLGISEHERVVLFVGRLVWEKGLKLWAEVIQRLERLQIPHRSLIVGEGPAETELRRMLPRTIFTGRISGETLSTAYASSDIFFFPSASETFGCVTVEALSSGLPCVVADATGSRDIVRAGIEGELCPPDNVPAFLDAVRRLLDEPERRNRYRERALLRARDYQWESVLSRMLDCMREAQRMRP